MTKKENFVAINALLNEIGHDEFNEFIAKEIASLEKRASYKSSKPTKNQMENEAIKAEIANVLSTEGQTVTEILAQLDSSAYSKPLTNQRVSALLRQMVPSVADKKIVKGKSLFTLA